MITLNEIAGYLPYGLKCKINSKLYPDPILTGLNKNYVYLNYYGTFLSFEMSIVKPILRPLSDLIKEIEVNGEKFVPIAELAKVCYKKAGYDAKVIDGECFVFSNNYQFSVFSYSFYHQSFYLTSCNGLNDEFGVHKQLQLFQKLYEWHFDIHGLIERGDAIDINTLKTKEEMK